MACCAALTLLFAWIYRVVGWFAPNTEDDFAPPATWPPSDHVAARPSASPRHQVALGQACIVIGIAWFAAGMLAMHVLGLVEPIDSLPVDVAFHMSGLWIATVGLALRFASPNLLRSPA